VSNGGAQHIAFGPFFTAAGVLYPFIKVYHYAAGTSNDKTAWSDEDKQTAIAQPFIGDSTGIARFFADGDYKFVIKDENDADLDNPISWDAVKVTSDTGTMWEGNFGTSYPSAVAANRWHLFAKVTAGNKLVFVGINDGTAFRDIAQAIGVGADVASGAALPVLSDGDYADVTGVTTITSIDSIGVGTRKTLQFDGVVTITHHATNLILPSGNNIVTKAGDVLTFFEYASGDWRLISANRSMDSKGADIVSAAALPVLAPGTFDVTGANSITSIDTIGIGSVVYLHFDAALVLTHNATDLVLPGAADFTTKAGDEFTFMEYDSGDWRCIAYALADGRSIASIDLQTKIDTTSGTTHDFTGVPLWVKEITIMFAGVSTNGTSIPIIQLGDAGGFETSNYLGSVSNIGGVSNHNTGFALNDTHGAVNVFHGVLTLSLLDPVTNTWAMKGNLGRSDGAAMIVIGGSKALSAILTQVRLTTVNGTDAFDAGDVNLSWR
jgi:hypothetical protein